MRLMETRSNGVEESTAVLDQGGPPLLGCIGAYVDDAAAVSQRSEAVLHYVYVSGAGDLPDPGKDRIEQRPIEYHRQVLENYRAQAQSDPDRYRIIRADRSIDEVQEEKEAVKA